VGKSSEDRSQHVGRYRLPTIIGEGGMGRVYRAIDSRSDKQLP
jgi:serine/threonine protein kinase